jgi:hypothetical protein
LLTISRLPSQECLVVIATASTSDPDDHSEEPEEEHHYFDANILFDDDFAPEPDLFTDTAQIDTKIGCTSDSP